jgi:tetratricopeptide (TPR) repeat protein
VYPLTVAAVLTAPDRLPGFLTLFLQMEPDKDAVATYCHGGSMLVIIYSGLGPLTVSTQLRGRVLQFSKGLSEHEHATWTYFYFAEGLHYDLELKLPYTSVQMYQKGIRAAEQAGDRHVHPVLVGWLSRALVNLGQQQTETLGALRAALAAAEQTKDLVPLSYAQAFLARWLADSPHPEDWQEAKLLAPLALRSVNPNAIGLAHRTLAQIAFVQGDLETAETEAQIALQFQSMFPPHKAEPAAFLSRILHARGKDTESLQTCETARQEQLDLGVESYGLLALLVTLAQARERAGLHEAAMEAVKQALPILRRRVADIPDPSLRAAYLQKVPENAHLLELAAEWKIGADLPP